MTPNRLQAGFTLIELMVVVVIMAVMVAVGVISMGGNEQASLRAQASSVKALLAYVRDTAAIKQTLYLVAPDEQGLTTYQLTSGNWEKASRIQPLAWDKSLNIEWDIDNATFARQQALPKDGWVFWPGGEVLAGSIQLKTQAQANTALEKASSYSFRWNELLQFSALNETSP